MDLIGKGGHIRTVPIPNWVKAALDQWTRAAGVCEGKIFRAVAGRGKMNRRQQNRCHDFFKIDPTHDGFSRQFVSDAKGKIYSSSSRHWPALAKLVGRVGRFGIVINMLLW